jgi:hypothetical protein
MSVRRARTSSVTVALRAPHRGDGRWGGPRRRQAGYAKEQTKLWPRNAVLTLARRTSPLSTLAVSPAALPARPARRTRGRPRGMARVAGVEDRRAARDAGHHAGEHVGDELHLVQHPDVEHVEARHVHVHALLLRAAGVRLVERHHPGIGLAVADPGMVVPPVVVAGEALGRATGGRAHVVVVADP